MRIFVEAEDQQRAIALLRDASIWAGGAIIHQQERTYGVVTIPEKDLQPVLRALANAGIKASIEAPE